MGPMNPGSEPVALRTRSALDIRSGLATPGNFCAFTAFSSWSPRTTKATTSPSLPSTSKVLTQRAASTPSCAESSAMVRAFGVGILVRGSAGAGRGGRDGGGHLEISRVIIGVGEGDGILAGVRENMEFVGGAAADAAAVRLHGTKFQADARKNARVRLVH